MLKAKFPTQGLVYLSWFPVNHLEALPPFTERTLLA